MNETASPSKAGMGTLEKAAIKEVSFRDATLKNVSFISRITLSKKY